MRIHLTLIFLTALSYLLLRKWSPELFTKSVQRAFFGLGAGVLGVWVVSRLLGDHSGTYGAVAKAAAGTWTVTMLVCIGLAGPLVLLRWLKTKFLKPSSPEPLDLSRRRLLGGVAIPVAAVGTGAGGTLSGLQSFEVRHEEIKIKGLPAALNGFKIGQLTDVHVGDFIDVDYLARAVDALDAAKVDLQVMTGDLIDDFTQLDATMEALDRVRAPHGMLTIIGNHEIWRGRQQTYAAYERIAKNGRVKFLVDQNTVIHHQGTPLRVVGVDYPMNDNGSHRLPKAERASKFKTMAEKAWTGVGADETVLCLTHHPDFFQFAAEKGAKLTLAGHTHGGQVGLLGIPLFAFAFEYMLGRYKRGESQLYVSGGTGHWLPYRIGVPTEVTVLTLRAV